VGVDIYLYTHSPLKKLAQLTMLHLPLSFFLFLPHPQQTNVLKQPDIDELCVFQNIENHLSILGISEGLPNLLFYYDLLGHQ
jgi:hypothetical protein